MLVHFHREAYSKLFIFCTVDEMTVRRPRVKYALIENNLFYVSISLKGSCLSGNPLWKYELFLPVTSIHHRAVGHLQQLRED